MVRLWDVLLTRFLEKTLIELDDDPVLKRFEGNTLLWSERFDWLLEYFREVSDLSVKLVPYEMIVNH